MRFSIIVPVYNIARWLPQCLDSVLAQTFSDWECVCVNDGSTDNSLKILSQYAVVDSRFVVIDKRNGGLSSARNAGLDRARGEYIVFLDGDDALDACYLAVIDSTLAANMNCDVVRVGFTAWVGENADSQELVDDGQCATGDGCALLVEIKQSFAMAPLNIVRRSVIEKIRFPEEIKIFEDIAYSLSLCRLIKSYISISYSGYLYRQSREGCLTSKARSDVEAAIFVKKIIEIWNEWPDDLHLKIAYAFMYELMFYLKHWLRGVRSVSQEECFRLRTALLRAQDLGLYDVSDIGAFSGFAPLGWLFSISWKYYISTGSFSLVRKMYWIYYEIVGLLSPMRKIKFIMRR